MSEHKPERTRSAVLQFNENVSCTRIDFGSVNDLANYLNISPSTGLKGRILVLEDLSTLSIETLGNNFNIEPHFFLNHLRKYRWWGLPTENNVANLSSTMREKTFFTYSYLEPRYIPNTRQLRSFQTLCDCNVRCFVSVCKSLTRASSAGVWPSV